MIKISNTLAKNKATREVLGLSYLLHTLPVRNNCDRVLKWKNKTVMITGSGGQIGKAIVKILSKELGPNQVIATDMPEEKNESLGPCKYFQLDVCDGEKFEHIVTKNKVDQIIHLAAIISALGEKNYQLAYDVNVTGTHNALNVAKNFGCGLFMPTSIACFGGNAYEKYNTSVDSVLQPDTIYGVTKVFNEGLGTYFHKKFGVDFRCLRYPAIVSSQNQVFNGTGGFGTEMFFSALEKKHYDSYLTADTEIQFLYIDECVQGTLDFIKTDRSKLKRCVYN